MSKLEEIVEYGLYGTKRALFIAPMMYLSETLCGLEGSQSLKSRAIAFGVNFFVAMPYNNWFKPKVYELMGVDEFSPDYKKDLANRVAFAAHQLPLYLGILATAGATIEQIAVALPTGVAVGIATAGKFQKFMDKASDYIENKYYKTKENLSYLLDVGKSYTKNLAYASLIAATMKFGMVNGYDYVKNNNMLTNQDKFVYVLDVGTESWINIDKENFNPKKHVLVFSEESSKVKATPQITLF